MMERFPSASAAGNADAIFVFAGRDSRKRTGVRLFREGRAPHLILSVGRFEWRRFPALGLPDDGGLVALVEATQPKFRHFFVRATTAASHCERVRPGRFGTWNEARALSHRVARDGYRRILVVSHRNHLPRCLLSLRVFLPRHTVVVPVAAEGNSDSEEPVSQVGELVKLGGYAVLAALERLGRPRRACAGSGFLL